MRSWLKMPLCLLSIFTHNFSFIRLYLLHSSTQILLYISCCKMFFLQLLAVLQLLDHWLLSVTPTFLREPRLRTGAPTATCSTTTQGNMSSIVQHRSSGPTSQPYALVSASDRDWVSGREEWSGESIWLSVWNREGLNSNKEFHQWAPPQSCWSH